MYRDYYENSKRNSAGCLQIVFLSILFAFAAMCLFCKPLIVEAINVPTTLTISICGDAIVNAGEVCDAGIAGNTGAYGSSTAERICTSDCLTFGPYCGDSILQVRFTEQCDDGNNTSGDLCTNACVAESSTAGGSSGSPAVGSIPAGAGFPGIIPSDPQTKVVL
ncbi:MAG: DUF4215 domain-containing protein, partial [Chitinophagaceae bacterium]